MKYLYIALTITASPSIALAQQSTPSVPTNGPTFYVSPLGNDSNQGTIAAPWRTIQKAASTLVAGDTAVLMDGIYEEGSVIFTRSGTASQPITFRAQNKWQAVLSSTSGCTPGFSISAGHITVKDIRFSVSPRNVPCGSFQSGNAAIRVWPSTSATPANPTTGYSGFVANGVKVDAGGGRALGIKSNQDFSVIENSEVGNGLELFNSRDSIIRNNLINGQDYWSGSIVVKGGVRSAQIYGNVIRNKASNGFGIHIGGYSCDTCFFDPNAKIEAYNSVAYNNVIINEGGGTLNALIFAGAKDSAFFNNVVIGGQLLMIQGGYNTGFRASTTNPTFRNNIIVCNPNAMAMNGQAAGVVTVDSNNFSSCGSVPAQTNAIVGDPQFVNRASDWHVLPGSVTLNRGAAASITGYNGAGIDVSRDMNGIVRTAPWDLGVYNN